MANNRGIVTERSSDSARPIKVNSTLPIALVVTSNIAAGIYGFDSPEDAINDDVIKTHTTGNMMKYLQLGVDEFPVIVPTIIVVCNEGVDDTETKSNIITGVNSIKKAASTVNLASSKGSIIGYNPDIIAVADYAIGDMDVANAMISVCTAIKARTFIDLDADSNGDAISQRDLFGSDRVTLSKTSLGKWNTKTNSTDYYDSGIVLAWLRAYVDGIDEIGWSKSISNQVLPFSSIKEPSDFVAGVLDETDPLTEAQIMSYITYMGIRTWNYQTTDADPIWQDARRVRIVDLASAAVLKGIFFAVDEPIVKLREAKKSLREFMNTLVGKNIMLAHEVKLDMKRTTPSEITAGRFYFIIDFQEMPVAVRICVTFNQTDRFAPLVYEMLNVA
ncbi:phage tail protein [Malaciobacter mytili LMG 24559]|uniref:Phage tail protein n=1 Tax=Malaciobacter mytili LMG 24559 TaxID=1032238 RepID=A0AAX2AKB4_9BACT|nr:phage tail protein [Malaciobacter mytili]AXH14378.1 major tail sheath protein [Malaciobacter mytili LMG 24559]RXK16046.1 phage tail protein [Malaciobacter mytili LMG 24559]